jgi:ubiquinone/menaquinone biosynthesis C-methylase UbiE
MNLSPFHLLSKINSRAAHRVLALTSSKGGRCGTQNQANRDAWLERTLASIPAGHRILDAGAGEQQYKHLCTHLKYVAQDFAQYDGKGDGKGLQRGRWDQSNLDIVSDITAIPEPDASFDAIMCVEVFEHLPEPIKAIREFARLLKPGGNLIVTAPFCSLTHFAPYHFYTGFNRYFYETHLPANGFEIVELQENGNFFEYLAQEVRRIPSIAERYAEGNKCSRLESFAMKLCLSMLERFSKKDRGSNELLHFGCHVHAVKKGLV